MNVDQSSKFRGQDQKAEWEQNIHSHFLVYKAKSHKMYEIRQLWQSVIRRTYSIRFMYFPQHFQSWKLPQKTNKIGNHNGG